MVSSAKIGNIFIGGSQEQKGCTFWVQNIKVLFEIGHPHLQTELNYLDSFKSYFNSSDLGFLSSGVWDRWVGGVWGNHL